MDKAPMDTIMGKITNHFDSVNLYKIRVSKENKTITYIVQ